MSARNPHLFKLKHHVPAARARVWQAWTEAAHLNQWWGPKGFTVTTKELDLKPGGRFLYEMRIPGGGVMWGRFIYREIVAPSKLVFIVSFSNAEGGITRNPWDANWPLETLSTITFEEKNGGTEMVMDAVPYQANDKEKQTFLAGHSSLTQGWTGTFAQLDAYLAG